MNRSGRRLIALLLSLEILTSSGLVNAAESNFWAERRKTSTPSPRVQVAALPSTPLNPVLQQLPRPQVNPLSQSIERQISEAPSAAVRDRLEQAVRAVPANVATIRDVVAANDPAGRVIVHIQDVHLNDEAQANIEKTVAALAASAGAGVVALEGAFGPIDVAKSRTMPDREATEVAASYLLSQHRISGPVHAALTMPSAPVFVGVDDKAGYDGNVAAYKAAAPLRASMKEKLEALDRDLIERKRKVFPAPLVRFDAGVRDYDRGLSPMTSYVRLLSRGATELPQSITIFLQAQELESKMDFARVESERTKFLAALVGKLSQADLDRLMTMSVDYRTGKMGHSAFYTSLRALAAGRGVALSAYPAMDGYVRYVVLTDGIRAQDLFRDLDDLRAAQYRSLASTPEESALVAESERLSLAAKILDFALAPDEWQKYRETTAGRLAALGDMTPFEAFYEQAERRNDALSANLLAAMDRANTRVAILVTGGFHAPGVSARFAKAGVSTIDVVPRLTRVDGDGTAYLTVFTQEKTPLDKMFEGPKLFLAPHPGSENALSLGRALAAGVSDLTAAVAWLKGTDGIAVEKRTQGTRTTADFSTPDGRALLREIIERNGTRPEIAEVVALLDKPGGALTVTKSLRAALLAPLNLKFPEFNLKTISLEASLARLTENVRFAQGISLPYAVLYNSNFLAGAIAVAAGLFTGSLPIVLGAFVLSRLALLGSVIVHEAAHLAADGQPISRAVESLNLASPVADILLGRDIQNAGVVASQAALLDSTRARVAALAGPAITLVAFASAIAALTLGFGLDLSRIDALGAFVVAAANAVILLFSGDYRAAIQGRPINGQFRALGFGRAGFFSSRALGEAGVAKMTKGANDVLQVADADLSEDSKFSKALPNGLAIAGLFDGIGGLRGGRAASREAVRIVSDRLSRLTGRESEEQIQQALAESIQAVNDAIQEGGTTATVAVLVPQLDENGGRTGEVRAIIANAADSRAFMQVDGKLTSLTVDNAVPEDGQDKLVMDVNDVEYRRAQNRLDRLAEVDDDAQMGDMTRVQFRFRNVVEGSLGQGKTYKPVITAATLPAGARLLLTSDGVHDNLTDAEISAELGAGTSAADAADRLVKRASNRIQNEPNHIRRKNDDVTAVVVEVPVSTEEAQQRVAAAPVVPGLIQQPNGNLAGGVAAENIEIGDRTRVSITIGAKGTEARPNAFDGAVTVVKTPEGVMAIVREPGREPQTLSLVRGGRLFIGRMSGNDYKIGDGASGISRFHLMLRLDLDGRLEVRDLFSRNGTSIDVQNPVNTWKRSEAASAGNARDAEMTSLGSMESMMFTRYEALSAAKGSRRTSDLDTSEEALTSGLRNLARMEPRDDASADERRRMAVYKEFLPVLMSKYQDSKTANDYTRGDAWRAKVRLRIATLLAEAQTISVGEERSTKPISALPKNIAVSSAFQNTIGIAKASDRTTYRVIFREPSAGEARRPENDMRLSIKTTPDGRLVSFGIDRRIESGVFEPQTLNGKGNERVIGLLENTKLSLESIKSIELDFNKEFGFLNIYLTTDNGTERAFSVDLRERDEKLRVIPVVQNAATRAARAQAKEAVASVSRRTETAAPAANVVVENNLAVLNGRDFENAVMLGQYRRVPGRNRVNVDAVVDVYGRILAVGDRQRFPSELYDRIPSGELSLAILLVGQEDGTRTIDLATTDLKEPAGANLKASIEAANQEARTAEAQRAQSRESAIARISGSASAVVARNVSKIMGGDFWSLYNEESIGGNAGFGHAAVNGYADRNGNIIVFANIQSLTEADRARYDQGEIFAFTIRTKASSFIEGPKYELLTETMPDSVRDILTASVAQANQVANNEDQQFRATDTIQIRRQPVLYQRVLGGQVTEESAFNGSLAIPILLDAGSGQTAELEITRDAAGDAFLSVRNANGATISGLERPIRITGREITVGRLEASTVRLAYSAVSRTQLRISVNQQGQVVVVDQGTNPSRPTALTLNATFDRGLGVLRATGILRGLNALGLAGLAPAIVRIVFAPVWEAFQVYRPSFVQAHISDGVAPESARGLLRAGVLGIIGLSVVGAATAFFLAAGADASTTGRVVATVVGLLTGNIVTHAAVNLGLEVAQRRSDRRVLNGAGRLPAERVAARLIEAAQVVAAGRGQISINDVIGPAVRFQVGESFARNPTDAADAAAALALDREVILRELSSAVDGRIRAGDLTPVEAQRIAEKLSLWIGATVEIGNKDVVAVVRNAEDLANVEKLLSAPGRTGKTTIVAEPAVAREAQARFGSRANVIAPRSSLIGAEGLDLATLESLLQNDPLANQILANALLVVSNQVAFNAASLAPNSTFRNIDYKSLEDVVANLLTPLRVTKLGVVLDAARVIAVQA